jgi:hypothetical protein
VSKHSNREKEVMLHLQKNYKGIRVWRFDVGMAYALHTVKDALQEYKRTGSITQAMTKLQRITYGVNGFPDLAGIYYGIFIGIEIKVGKDKQRKEQKIMEKVIKEAGGIYILLTDKEPIESQLQPLKGIERWIKSQQ